MTTEDIKPALTPEAWDAQGFHYGTDVWACPANIVIGETGYFTPCGDGEEYPTGAEYKFSGDARHALAALALHGQPFGFTWEMVDALQAVAIAAATRGGLSTASLRLDDIADRIAALLPPRDGA